MNSEVTTRLTKQRFALRLDHVEVWFLQKYIRVYLPRDLSYLHSLTLTRFSASNLSASVVSHQANSASYPLRK